VLFFVALLALIFEELPVLVFAVLFFLLDVAAGFLLVVVLGVSLLWLVSWRAATVTLFTNSNGNATSAKGTTAAATVRILFIKRADLHLYQLYT
jgi:hypothetical protein